MTRHPRVRERPEVAAAGRQLLGQQPGQREAAVARGATCQTPADGEPDEGAGGSSGEAGRGLGQTFLR
jgi:hypothetical protein